MGVFCSAVYVAALIVSRKVCWNSFPTFSLLKQKH